MRSRFVRACGLGLLALLIASPATIASAQEEMAAPYVAMVVGDVSDFSTWGFAPVVPLGQSVTWTNQGQAPHTVTFQDLPLDSGTLDPGASATLFFDAPGIFRYLCTLHPNMVGAVVVAEDPTVSTPTLAIVEADPADPSAWGYALNINIGQSVVWSNTDSIQPHTATATDGAWDTSNIGPGESLPLGFDDPGLFAYICTPHPWMKNFLQVL
jgi:plastocyanin